MPAAVATGSVFDRVLRAIDAAGICSDEEIAISIRVGKAVRAPSSVTTAILSKAIKILQKDANVEERYVLGIVLEPLKELGKADVQADTYSAEEVRKACHVFMEDYGNMGLQHQLFVNGKVKILENWISPDDCTINGQFVAKGTWLMAVRIIDDGIWKAVKDGTLTGFSIGGKAQREPLTT